MISLATYAKPAPRQQPSPHLLHLTEVVSEAMLPLALGLALGLLALCSLRVARLRWSWALLAAPLIWPVWLVSWKVGLALGLAAALCAGAGAYWHLEDIRRGGDAARASRDAVGPLAFARARLAERRDGAGEGRVRGGGLALGRSRRGGLCRVPFGLNQGVHGLVLGATGSGKTVTQAAIADAYLRAGMGAIVLDPKGDRYLRGVLEDAAQAAGRAFREWTPRGPCVYNPLARGGPTEVTDKALAGSRWSEPHYELATQRLLGKVAATMRAAGKWPPTLSALVHHMDPDRLDALGAEVGGEIGASVAAYVDSLSARARADLGGGRDRLAVLAEGELGPWLDPSQEAGPELSLADSLRAGEVTYMHIDADRYPAASRLLGAAVIIDLVTLTADLHGEGVRGLVVVDEFAALAAEEVGRLFGRARSAGLSVLLGTQSLADLRGARPEDPTDSLTEQVLTNVAYAVIHREADPDSAERLARVAGTEPSFVTTEKVGGPVRKPWERPEGTRTPERRFVVSPDQFKRLGTGEAVVIQPTARRPAEVVEIWPAQGR